MYKIAVDKSISINKRGQGVNWQDGLWRIEQDFTSRQVFITISAGDDRDDVVALQIPLRQLADLINHANIYDDGTPPTDDTSTNGDRLTKLESRLEALERLEERLTFLERWVPSMEYRIMGMQMRGGSK